MVRDLRQPRRRWCRATRTATRRSTRSRPAAEADRACRAARGRRRRRPARRADRRRRATGGRWRATVVPQDPRRHLLLKREYIAAALRHLGHAGRPRLHGRQDLATRAGLLRLHPRPGLRFVVLDSVSDAGGDGGKLGQAQFAWLDDQLGEADAAGELTLVFAHHTLETMNQRREPVPAGRQPAAAVRGRAPGRGLRSQKASPSRVVAPRETSSGCCCATRPSSRYITGHEHRNRIRAVRARASTATRRADARTAASGKSRTSRPPRLAASVAAAGPRRERRRHDLALGHDPRARPRPTVGGRSVARAPACLDLGEVDSGPMPSRRGRPREAAGARATATWSSWCGIRARSAYI